MSVRDPSFMRQTPESRVNARASKRLSGKAGSLAKARRRKLDGKRSNGEWSLRCVLRLETVPLKGLCARRSTGSSLCYLRGRTVFVDEKIFSGTHFFVACRDEPCILRMRTHFTQRASENR